jgi:hypothetical protein
MCTGEIWGPHEEDGRHPILGIAGQAKVVSKAQAKDLQTPTVHGLQTGDRIPKLCSRPFLDKAFV